MKSKTKLFKPNTVICISSDSKNKKVYAVDVTTQKFYSHPQSTLVSSNITFIISFGLATIISILGEQNREQLYLSGATQSLEIVLIGISVLMGVAVFFLVFKKNHAFHLNEYLKKYPQSEEVTNRNEIIDKAHFIATVNFFLIIGGAIGSALMFEQFLRNSNLSTYFWATFLSMISSLLAAGIKQYIFILSLKS